MPEFDSTIEYRPVVGFPGYLVGNDGSIWSSRIGHSLGHGKGAVPGIGTTWHLVKPQIHPIDKHCRVVLFPAKVRKFVHVLVLEAFVGPCPDGMECRHFPDRSPANNRLDNLQWGTKQENEHDKKNHGTVRVGSKHPRATLTEPKVLEIFRRLRNKESFAAIGRAVGTSKKNVRFIALRKAWSHLNPEPQPTA